MVNNIFRITDNVIFRVFNTPTIEDYYEIENQLVWTNNTHNMNYNNIVWDSGEFQHRINKIFSEPLLINPETESSGKISLPSVNYQILLKQGYVWNDVDTFGIHIIIKNQKSNIVYFSRILGLNDFKISDSPLLIDGSFWNEESNTLIPQTNEILSVQVTEIKFNDIILSGSSIGYILNYPQTLIPLVNEKPIPDFLKTILSFDENHFLKVQLITTENKSVEQSILDSLNIEIGNIQITHNIYVENDMGYGVSNLVDKYLPVIIGINLIKYLDIQDKITIFVQTVIDVEGKQMIRDNQISTNIANINPFIENLITHPDTNFPVEITENTEIIQTVISKKENTKLINIPQPVYIEFITDDIIYANKFVTLNSITGPSYMFIHATDTDKNPQELTTEVTSDGVYYFDLGKLIPISENTEYALADIVSQKIIGRGNLLIK